ncbi:MAG: type I DNA topoisomerase [Bdellovibrionales bacterium]|nr:type I DNA topoisomerase [Bdellovibrionales bacterium]
MTKQLVIVESPTKAKTIEKFLGKGFDVRASYGHVRDLPNNAAEIPEAVKKEKWSRLGVNVDSNFEPLYIIPDNKKKNIQELKKLLKEADEVLLATDEDREGESISWHLLEVLKPKVPVKRLVFHEITKDAINHALESARDVDMNLVKAQETRRVVDRLFGYELSPILWRKMAPRLSAGRVQSVALRLLVERERERISFVKAFYWDLKALFSKAGSSKSQDAFEAELTHVDDKRVAIGKDFEQTTGKLKDKSDVVHLDKKGSEDLRAALAEKKAKVISIEEKPFSSKPYPPFTTSTLQQEANRKLSFSARRTMSVAQKLYENGLITYMRTDSTTLSNEAIEAARSFIISDYGKEYCPASPREYKTKVKNAQEAHEAIRPAGSQFTPIDDVRKKMGQEAAKLYELIWKRTVACQMNDARGTRVGVQLEVKNARFRASGKTISFPGFMRAYVEGSDDPEAELSDQEKFLPKLSEGEELDIKKMEALEHSTLPPARYTEGSLIKELEKRGIGRPSTWATIVDVVLSRTYAHKKGNSLVPTFLAHAVIGMLEKHFTYLVDYEFTAQLEDDLDEIAVGKKDNVKYLKNFYYGNGLPGVKTLCDKGLEEIDPRIVCGLPIGTKEDGTEVEVRIGRYGPFLTDGENRAGVPDEVAPDEMSVDKAVELLEIAARGPQSLGEHPDTKQPVYLKSGRFGPYVQLGDQEEGGDKPKMVSLLPGMEPESVTFETAVKLLSLPINLGKHDELKEDILVANGRYGPYIKCGSETRSINTDLYSVLDLTKEQAVEILKEPKRRGRGVAKPPLKDVGEHPDTKAKILIKSGRFGPYVTDGKINASIPSGENPEEVTLEFALNLLAERQARIDAKGGSAGGKSKAKAKTKTKSTKAKSTKAKSAKTKDKPKAKAKTSAKKPAKKAKKKEASSSDE